MFVVLALPILFVYCIYICMPNRRALAFAVIIGLALMLYWYVSVQNRPDTFDDDGILGGADNWLIAGFLLTIFFGTSARLMTLWLTARRFDPAVSMLVWALGLPVGFFMVWIVAQLQDYVHWWQYRRPAPPACISGPLPVQIGNRHFQIPQVQGVSVSQKNDKRMDYYFLGFPRDQRHVCELTAVRTKAMSIDAVNVDLSHDNFVSSPLCGPNKAKWLKVYCQDQSIPSWQRSSKLDIPSELWILRASGSDQTDLGLPWSSYDPTQDRKVGVANKFVPWVMTLPTEDANGAPITAMCRELQYGPGDADVTCAVRYDDGGGLFYEFEFLAARSDIARKGTAVLTAVRAWIEEWETKHN
jgi:hypothetical protein